MTISEETRRKMSEAHKGKCAWNKGKTGIYSEETRRKMSEAQIGKHHTDETKRKLSESHKGKSHTVSEETKIKIGLASKGRKHTEEERNKISKGNKEHQKAISEETEKLRKEGYKLINGDLSPKPDIIAFKDGKLIAIEVEFGKPNFKKYKDIDFFDDVIWIKKVR